MASSSSRLTCTTWVSMTACLPPGPQPVAGGALPDGRPGDRGEGTVLTSAQQEVVLLQQARSESVALAGEPFRPEVPVAIFPADLDPGAGGVHRWPAVAPCRCSHLLNCLDAGSTPDACLQLASGGCRPEPGASFSVASTVRPVAVRRPREASDAALTSTRQSHSSALMGRDLGRRRANREGLPLRWECTRVR